MDKDNNSSRVPNKRGRKRRAQEMRRGKVANQSLWLLLMLLLLLPLPNHCFPAQELSDRAKSGQKEKEEDSAQCEAESTALETQRAASATRVALFGPAAANQAHIEHELSVQGVSTTRRLRALATELASCVADSVQRA